MKSDTRVMFPYPNTTLTPAMVVSKAGIGSDYGIAFVDSAKQTSGGSKTYKLNTSANPPAKYFRALTLYDNQTRSQRQTSQLFPSAGSQTEGFK